MTTTINEKTYEYRGLSTDVKPMEKAGNGSVFIEMDTGKVYIFDEENLIWIELSKKSGDSDTGSGGSGGGADIASNILVTANKDDILGITEHNKLCILSNTGDLTFKIVDKIEGGSEELSTLSEVLPQALNRFCCATYGDNIYIFGGYNGSSRVNTIYKFNCISKTITKLSATLSRNLEYSCCATYEDKIYIFGDYDGYDLYRSIYKFNCTNETISRVTTAELGQGLYQLCCAIYENYIYIFGGNYGSATNTIYKFNCISETITKLSVTLPKNVRRACCSINNDNVYIFGGNNGGDYNTIYKFNCVTETIETLSTTLPRTLDEHCCAIFEDSIYIFGGYGSNQIYKFNCVTETIETLSTTFLTNLYRSCCSTYNSNIFIFGGYDGTNTLNTIYQFSVSFELTVNNVLILNANSNYSFDLITDQVTIPINKVYIGDSNNTAKLANAYLYDETQTAWVNVNTGEVLS